MRGARLEPARLLDARPENPQGAEFRQRRQFVRVGRESERNHGARFGRRRPGRLEQSQQADSRRKREGEFLRRAPAGRMDGARVSDQERPAEALAPDFKRGFDMARRLSAPIRRERSARHGRERIEAERDRAVLRLGARAFDESAKTKRVVRAIRPKIEFETRACIEAHAIEGLVKRGRIRPSEAKSIGADRAGKYDLQTVRPIGEVVERLGAGLLSVGMIEARDDAPGPSGPDRPWAFRRRMDGFDPNAVRGFGCKRFEARAFERSFGGFTPVGL